MTSTPAPAAVIDLAGLDNATTHIFCCSSDISLCGCDLSTTPEVPDGVGHDCVVCLDLETQPCPRCGYNPDEETSR